MSAPILPRAANDWLNTPNASMALGNFPPNLATVLDEDFQKTIVRFIQDKYIFPQIFERRPFETMWEKILEMYRIKLDKIDLAIEEASPAGEKQKSESDESNSGQSVRLADSVFFDAVERLTDVHHFIAFKEGLPVQYNIPKYYDLRNEDSFYHPFRDKIQSANNLLLWNADNEDIFLKHLILCRHFYQYGICFNRSEFAFEMRDVPKMAPNGMQTVIRQISRIGTTFDPISIHKLWLNWRLMASEMDYQPCPFFYEEMPRFATLQNQYDRQVNPLGFWNLDKVGISNPQYLFSSPEASAASTAIQGIMALNKGQTTIPGILEPQYSVEALWTLYPMLPLDPSTGDWITRKDGTPVPMQRFIVNLWGENLHSKMILLRCQRNFYPHDKLPLYASTHMPDLDSGLYAPSMGYLLWNHYKEIVTCKNQYVVNKDLINNPPTWVQAGSPALNQNLTKAGSKIIANGKNDFGYREVPDATQSTVGMMTHLREQSQTTTKSQDAILGKALGGRTSATEAQNVFQASMSAITTPINIFNHDIMGGYADRVWEYTGTWFPPELLRQITGQMGLSALTAEDLWLKVGVKWDIGSTYIESIVRQQNIRYALESSFGDPSINRAGLWKQLLNEWKFNTEEIVNDQGFEKEVYLATNQAIETFLGNDAIFINPDQNHAIAIKVKTAFLEDSRSKWMTDYRDRAPLLGQQIMYHQKLYEAQIRLQMLMQEANRPIGDKTSGGAPPLQSQNQPATGGEMTQHAQTGGGLVG